jgi:putative ABC transport system permease protein
MAALTIAVATTIGVGVMIDSFRDTLANWLQTYLRADIYLSSSSGDNHPLDPALVKRITATPGVATHSSGRHFHIETSTGHTEVLALDLPPQSLPAFQFKEGNPDKVWPAFKHDDGVIVSEPYAYHHRLHAGDTLTLRTDAGPRTFPVAGIFYHYGTDQGVVFLSRGTYEKYWRDGGVTSLGLYAAPGIELDELTTRLRNRIGTDHQLSIRTNRTLRELSLEIFERTFAITGVLRILTIVVAFIGILSALMALQLERARELAVLRAIGLTPNGLRGLVTTQTGLIGLIAGLLAIPLGLVLAVVLIYEINRMSFGWTMQLFIDPVVLIQALLLALAAALLAGVYPALKMARTPPALALRED